MSFNARLLTDSNEYDPASRVVGSGVVRYLRSGQSDNGENRLAQEVIVRCVVQHKAVRPAMGKGSGLLVSLFSHFDLLFSRLDDARSTVRDKL